MLFLYSPPEEINEESTYSSHTEDTVSSGQRKEPDGLSGVTEQAARGRPLCQAGNRKRVSSEPAQGKGRPRSQGRAGKREPEAASG